MNCKCGYQTLENAGLCLKCKNEYEELLKKWIKRKEELSWVKE